MSPAQPVEIFFAPTAGGVERSFRSDVVATDHVVQLAMMKADTPHSWRAVAPRDPNLEDQGSFVSGSLSGGCDVAASVTGQSSATYVVAQSPCDAPFSSPNPTPWKNRVVVLDGDGDVVWCDAFDDASGGWLEGVSLTEDGTFVGVQSDAIIEKDLFGNELLHLVRGVDYGHAVHHDVFRKDGLTYALFRDRQMYDGNAVNLDGFYVFDGTAMVGEWRLSDWLVPVPDPSGSYRVDYSHANSLWVDDHGELLLSMRHLSTVASIAGDPYDPMFGTINWFLASPESEIASDLAWSSSVSGPVDFRMQHNPHVLPTGELAVFDNRCQATAGVDSDCPVQDDSRVILLDLDSNPGTAEIVESYELPRFCSFQGSAWHTAAENPVGTCAPFREAYEFDRQTGAQLWHMQLTCAGAPPGSYVPRFIPWEGPW